MHSYPNLSKLASALGLFADYLQGLPPIEQAKAVLGRKRTFPHAREQGPLY